MGDQNESSFWSRTRRKKLIPQVWTESFENFKVRNGIAISANQRSSVIRVFTNHTPSQLAFRSVSLDWESHFAPAALIANS